MLKKINLLVIFSLISAATAFAATVSQKVSLRDGKEFNLSLPENFEIIPAAENLGRVRFFAKSPDGRIFVADTFNMSDNFNGTIYILDDFNEKTGKFGKVTPYLKNLHIPNSVQFYTDEKGQDWIYIAETQQLTRRKFKRGENAPTDTKPEVLATFPAYGLSYKYGSWHLTRTIAISPAGKLYVSIGTSCNSCIEKPEEKDVRGVVLEMNPDGSNRRVYVKNIRNAVGLKWIGDKFFATVEGVDHLGVDKPDDVFYQLKENANYGWAQCYQANGVIEFDPKFATKKKKPDCSFVPASDAYFPAHSSAMGFDFFDDATTDETLKNSFVMALHGSTNRDDGRGYKIVTVRDGNVQKDFITGFLQGINIFGRPCDIMKLSADSFIFSDDYNGIIYLVRSKLKLVPKPFVFKPPTPKKDTKKPAKRKPTVRKKADAPVKKKP